MRSNNLKLALTTAFLAVTILLFGGSASLAQSTVNLTAGATSITLPDGKNVPMWGYSCTGAAPTNATCAASNPNAGTGWSPVVITVPFNAAGTTLNINLTNALSFPATPSGTNTVPTSLTIVGQLGGGLGANPVRTTSPDHTTPQGTTWPIANSGAQFLPPPQAGRVQSFGTEVLVGTPQTLTWSNLKPGTYLIESGTHPSIQGSMGLYGVLVVTTAPVSPTLGTAYTGVNYAAGCP